jgi:hypothetical protein
MSRFGNLYEEKSGNPAANSEWGKSPHFPFPCRNFALGINLKQNSRFEIKNYVEKKLVLIKSTFELMSTCLHGATRHRATQIDTMRHKLERILTLNIIVRAKRAFW